MQVQAKALLAMVRLHHGGLRWSYLEALGKLLAQSGIEPEALGMTPDEIKHMQRSMEE